MATVISISNQKGGVSKTTTACTFAAGLKRKGYKVLAIDMDPQGNLSDSVRADAYNSPSIYEVLTRKEDVKSAIQQLPAFDIIPANIILASAEPQFNETGKEYRLKETLEPILDHYDYVVIDTPPALSILTINAFVCSSQIIVPVTPSIFAAKGMNQLYETIQNIRKYCNKDLRIAGILLTKYNARTNLNKEMKSIIQEVVNQMNNAEVYNTYIRQGIAVEESQASGMDLFSYSIKLKANVAADYDQFVAEYLQREGK